METTDGIVSVFDRHSEKMGWKASTTSTSCLCTPCLVLVFCTVLLLVFCSGFRLEDFQMLTELSRYNLGVAFSRSHQGHNWWTLVAFAVCYSPLI